MAQEVSLTIDQGSYFKQPFKFFADEDNTEILDLSDAVAAMQFKKNDYDGQVILSLTSDVSGGLTIDTVNGVIEVEIGADLTASLRAAKGDDAITGRYDLEIEVGGIKRRLVQGDFTITREVTVI